MVKAAHPVQAAAVGASSNSLPKTQHVAGFLRSVDVGICEKRL